MNMFKDFMSDWNEMSPEKREETRNEINIQSVFSRCEEVTEEVLLDEDHLDRGDFIIGRVIWDGDKEKYHDHWAIVTERKEDGIDVVFFSDISKTGEKPQSVFWKFDILASNMKEGKLNLLRFNLLDVQDEDDIVVGRAKAYKAPKGKPDLMQFAFVCTFGFKHPIFSEEQLQLCDKKTLVLLREGDKGIPLLLHKFKDGKFHVSLEADDDDIKEMTFDEILDLSGPNNEAIYYYPGLKIESLSQTMSKIKGNTMDGEEGGHLAHHITHSTVEVVSVHVFEHGLKHGIKAGSHIIDEVLEVSIAHGAKEMAGTISHVGGGALHGLISGSIATHQTRKARRKEKIFAKTGGLKGFSRTKANKNVTKNWSGAVAGTGGSIGMGLAGASVGTFFFPGVGTAIGGVVGGVIGSVLAGTVAKKTAGAIYDSNISNKCPLC